MSRLLSIKVMSLLILVRTRYTKLRGWSFRRSSISESPWTRDYASWGSQTIIARRCGIQRMPLTPLLQSLLDWGRLFRDPLEVKLENVLRYGNLVSVLIQDTEDLVRMNGRPSFNWDKDWGCSPIRTAQSVPFEFPAIAAERREKGNPKEGLASWKHWDTFSW